MLGLRQRKNSDKEGRKNEWKVEVNILYGRDIRLKVGLLSQAGGSV